MHAFNIKLEHLIILIARISSLRNILVHRGRRRWLLAHISDRASSRQLGSKRPKVFNTFSCFYGGWHLLFFIVSPLFPACSFSRSFFCFLGGTRTRVRAYRRKREKRRFTVSPLWCTTRRSAWKKSHKPVKKHGVSGPGEMGEMDEASRREEEDAVRAGERGSSIAKGIPLMTNHAWFSFVCPLPTSLLPFCTAALPDSSNARFFTFVSALSLLLSSLLASPFDSFASLNLSHLPI